MSNKTVLATFEMVETNSGKTYFRCVAGGYSYTNESLPDLLDEIYNDKVINFVLANINLDRLENNHDDKRS